MSVNVPSMLLAPLTAENTTLQQQLYQRIKLAILSGQLLAGTRLPATRQLAHELQISRNTVINVWAQLQAEGYLLSDRQGSRVSAMVLPAINSMADGYPVQNSRLAHFKTRAKPVTTSSY